MLPLDPSIYYPQGTWNASHSWLGGAYSVSGYESQQDAIDALWRGLNSMGYKEPVWWEFWRWGERRPPSTKNKLH